MGVPVAVAAEGVVAAHVVGDAVQVHRQLGCLPVVVVQRGHQQAGRGRRAPRRRDLVAARRRTAVAVGVHRHEGVGVEAGGNGRRQQLDLDSLRLQQHRRGARYRHVDFHLGDAGGVGSGGGAQAGQFRRQFGRIQMPDLDPDPPRRPSAAQHDRAGRAPERGGAPQCGRQELSGVRNQPGADEQRRGQDRQAASHDTHAAD